MSPRRWLRSRRLVSPLDLSVALPRQRLASPAPDGAGWVMVCPACGVRTLEAGTVEAAEHVGRMHDGAIHGGSWSARAVLVEDAGRVVRMVAR